MSFHFYEVYGIAVLSAEICGREMLRIVMSLGLISFTFESWSLLNNFIVKQHWKVILSSYLLHPLVLTAFCSHLSIVIYLSVFLQLTLVDYGFTTP